MKWPVYFWLYTLLLLLILSCNNINSSTDSSSAKDNTKAENLADSIVDEETLNTIATEILTTLKTKDYTAFTAYFHPVDGVLFSPYAFIDTKNSQKLSKTSFLKAVNQNSILNWGNDDASGEAIKLTAQQYLQKFGYNANYLQTDKIGYNQVIGSGNTTSNLSTVYPKHPFIEYYVSTHNETAWSSLRLVFSIYQGTYYLVAVIHDQWTS